MTKITFEDHTGQRMTVDAHSCYFEPRVNMG